MLLLAEELVGCEVHDLAITHNNQVAIVATCSLYETALSQQDAGVDAFYKFSYLEITHNSKSSGTLTDLPPLLFHFSSHKLSS